MKKKIAKITLCILTVCCIAVTSLCIIADDSHGAGTVTDTLTVKVGYWGMSDDKYVEKGTFHWSELQSVLPVYEDAYSFFRQDTTGDYATIIDSARGFTLASLMSYLNIDAGNITNISFYTRDVEVGYFCSFTYSELFTSQRYYFNDLNYYLIPKFNDKDEVVGYTLDNEVWNDRWTVEPMLALEDSWATYEAEQQGGTAPDYSNMGTGNRFRLLFGQTSPTEAKTNQTAKYVHTLLVAYSGTPTVVNNAKPLSGKVGKHTARFQVDAGDDGMVSSLAGLMKWSSTNEDVMTIESVRMQASSEFNNIVEVEIDYTVNKAGEASIAGSYAGLDVKSEMLTISESPGNGDGDEGSSNKGDAGTETTAGDSGRSQGSKANQARAYALSDNVASMLSDATAKAELAKAYEDSIEVNKENLYFVPYMIFTAIILLFTGMVTDKIFFKRRLYGVKKKKIHRFNRIKREAK